MQAARGTTLTTSQPSPPPLQRTRSRVVLWTAALLAYAVDVTTKELALRHLDSTSSVPLVGDLLQLTLVRNPGAAFNTGVRFTYAFTALAIVAIVVVLVMSRRVAHRGWGLAFGLLLAGVAGNLTDRIIRDPGPFRGHVVDFLQLPHWPVFNIADICIDTAAGLMILLSFRGITLAGDRIAKESES